MRTTGNTPEDQHATNDYLTIQDFVYDIVKQYETQGRYEFFIMLAGEMMHNAVNNGLALGMDESKILSEFSEEIDSHRMNQESVKKAQQWIERWNK